MEVTQAEWAMIANLGVSLILGASIGVERQWRQRMAGVRTNALVSAGASLFCVLAQALPNNGDLTRIPSYIVSGVGFLGAGVFMKEGGSVRGLNTAATLWCSAAVGSLAGFGFHFLACVGAGFVVLTHLCLRPVADKINRQPHVRSDEEFHYRISVVCRERDEARVRSLVLNAMAPSSLVLKSLESQGLSESNKVCVQADVESLAKNPALLEQVVSRLCLEPGVSTASWNVATL